MTFKFYYGEIIYYRKSRVNTLPEIWELAIVLKVRAHKMFLLKNKETGENIVIAKERMLKLSEMKVKELMEVK